MKLTVSTNKLAEFAVSNTARRLRIVQDLKKSAKGYPPYYGAFRGPAREFLLGGATQSGVLAIAAERVAARRGSNRLSIDSRITVEAFRALQAAAPLVHRLRAQFARLPSVRKQPVLGLRYLDVKAAPDLLLSSVRNGVPVSGGLRLYVAKESRYELGPHGAELVAAMIHQWLVAHSDRVPDPASCVVLECFQQRLTAAPRDIHAALEELDRASLNLLHLWSSIDGEDAA